MVLGAGSSTRELDLLGRALNACGAALARAPRVTVSAGQLHDVPAASAYLVFGEAQAHALGRGLPVAVMQRAQIVLVDELAQVLTERRRQAPLVERAAQVASTPGSGERLNVMAAVVKPQIRCAPCAPGTWPRSARWKWLPMSFRGRPAFSAIA